MFTTRPIRNSLPTGRSMSTMFGSSPSTTHKNTAKSTVSAPAKHGSMSSLWRAAPQPGSRK